MIIYQEKIAAPKPPSVVRGELSGKFKTMTVLRDENSSIVRPKQRRLGWRPLIDLLIGSRDLRKLRRRDET